MTTELSLALKLVPNLNSQWVMTVVQIPESDPWGGGNGRWESSSEVAQPIPEKPVGALRRMAGHPGMDSPREGTVLFWRHLVSSYWPLLGYSSLGDYESLWDCLRTVTALACLQTCT